MEITWVVRLELTPSTVTVPVVPLLTKAAICNAPASTAPPFEIVSVGVRDDSGKVRRTLLRDERAAWLKQERAFQIKPTRMRAG